MLTPVLVPVKVSFLPAVVFANVPGSVFKFPPTIISNAPLKLLVPDNTKLFATLIADNIVTVGATPPKYEIL